jgi:hypothetical protein
MRKFLLLFLLTTSCLAQTNRKPLFALPKALTEVPAASSVTPELRAALATELAARSCKLNGSEKYGLAEIDLQHEGKATLVRVEDDCLCGASGNCPIFVLQKSKLLLRDGEGFAFAQIPDAKGGSTPDLLLASHTSANVTSLQRFRWRGGKFKLQDCEAAVRKDDAKDTKWNTEELDITSCDAIAVK